MPNISRDPYEVFDPIEYRKSLRREEEERNKLLKEKLEEEKNLKGSSDLNFESYQKANELSQGFPIENTEKFDPIMHNIYTENLEMGDPGGTPPDLDLTGVNEDAFISLKNKFSGSSKTRRGLADPLVAISKGIVSLPQTVVGLADIVSGGNVGKTLEDSTLVQFKKTQEELDKLYSPEVIAAREKVQKAKGFGGKIVAMLQNPSTIATGLIESLPSMGAGGAVAKGVGLIPKVVPYIAGAIGEGVVGAGQAAEQIREESDTGLLTPKQSTLSLVSGVADGIIGILGGKVAKKLKIEDIDTLLAGDVPTETKKSIWKRVFLGGMVEGGIEEFPQGVQERINQNVAQDKPWDAGLADAAQDMLIGTLMGGGSQFAASQTTAAESPDDKFLERKNSYILNEETREYSLGEGKPLTGQSMRDLIVLNNPQMNSSHVDLFIAYAQAMAEASENTLDGFIEENGISLGRGTEGVGSESLAQDSFTKGERDVISWATDVMDKETLSEILEREVTDQEVKDLEEQNWSKISPDILADLKYRLTKQYQDMEEGALEDLMAKGASVKGAAAGAASQTRVAMKAWDKIEKFSKDPSLYQPTFHGTSQIFDEFDTSKIGTGQGAQSFGWGIYVAEALGVAQSIERQLSNRTIKVDWLNPNQKEVTPIAEDAMERVKQRGSVGKTIDNIEDSLTLPTSEQHKEYLTQLKNWLVENGKDLSVKSSGHMLKVKLDDSKRDRFLDLDKPLKEQSQFVQNIIKDMVSKGEIRPMSPETSGKIWNMVLQEREGDKGASLKLLEKGILGNKYLDAQSRDTTKKDFVISKTDSNTYYVKDKDLGRVYVETTTEELAKKELAKLKQGTSNYVLFDPKQVVKGMERLYQEHRGATTFLKEGRTLISFFKEANLSTLFHEHAHIVLKYLNASQLEIIAKWTGVNIRALLEFKANPRKALQSKWRADIEHAQEEWAKGFEKYIYDGKVPVKGLKKLFELGKKMLRQAYLLAKDERISGFVIPPEVRSIYDSLFITDKERFGGKVVSSEGTFLVFKDSSGHAAIEVESQGKKFNIRVDNLITGKNTSLSPDKTIAKAELDLQRNFLKDKVIWVSPLENRTYQDGLQFEWDLKSLSDLDQNTLEKLAIDAGVKEPAFMNKKDLVIMISENLRLQREIPLGIKTNLAVDEGSFFVKYAGKYRNAFKAKNGHLFRGLIENFFLPLLEDIRYAGGTSQQRLAGTPVSPLQELAYKKSWTAIDSMIALKGSLRLIMEKVQNLTNGEKNPLGKKSQVVRELHKFVDLNGKDFSLKKEGVGFSVLHKAVENPDYRKTLPSYLQQAIDAFRAVVRETGWRMEQAGVKINIKSKEYNEETKRWEMVDKEIPFKADLEGNKFEQHFTSQFLFALKQEDDTIRKILSQWLPTIPGNEHLTPEFCLQQLTDLGKANTRRAHMEFARQITLPTVLRFKVKGGSQTLQILHTEAYELVEKMVDQTSSFLGFRKAFGDTKESQSFLNNFGEITKHRTELETLYKALNNIPLFNETFTEPGTVLSIVEEDTHGLVKLFKAGKLSGSAIVNTPETLRLPAFASNRDYLKALGKILIPLIKGDKNALMELTQNLKTVASISNTIPKYIIRNDPFYFGKDWIDVVSRGWLRMVKVSQINTVNEIISALTAQEMIKRFGGGQGSEWDAYRLSLLKFDEEQINILLNAPDKTTKEYKELATAVVGRMPLLTQGTPQIPALQSKFGNWRLGNDVYGFTSFFRNNTMRTTDMFRGVWNTRKANGMTKFIAWTTLGQFCGNSMVAGMLALGMRAIILGGPAVFLYKKWDEDDDDVLLDDWLNLMGQGFLATMWGGPIDFILRAHEKGDKNTIHTMIDSTIPGAMLIEMGKFISDIFNPGIHGIDPYRRLVERWCTMTPAIKTWASISYIAARNNTLEHSLRQYYKYRKERLGRVEIDLIPPTEGETEVLGKMTLNEQLELNQTIADSVNLIKEASIESSTRALDWIDKDRKDHPTIFGEKSLTSIERFMLQKSMPSIFTTAYRKNREANQKLMDVMIKIGLHSDVEPQSYVIRNLKSRKTVSRMSEEEQMRFKSRVGEPVYLELEYFDEVLENFAEGLK